MIGKIALVTIVVPDYEPALDFFVARLGFDLVEDFPMGKKRWVVVRPKGCETGLLLGRADGKNQTLAIGNQSGGRVAFILHSDDFEADAKHIVNAGGVFEEDRRDEVYGKVAVFRDPFGNRWDLLQPSNI